MIDRETTRLLDRLEDGHREGPSEHGPGSTLLGTRFVADKYRDVSGKREWFGNLKLAISSNEKAPVIGSLFAIESHLQCSRGIAPRHKVVAAGGYFAGDKGPFNLLRVKFAQ